MHSGGPNKHPNSRQCYHHSPANKNSMRFAPLSCMSLGQKHQHSHTVQATAHPHLAWPLLKSWVLYLLADSTPKVASSSLSPDSALPGVMSAKGLHPTGRLLKYSPTTCTGQVMGLVAHQQYLHMQPHKGGIVNIGYAPHLLRWLPCGLFFLLLSTSSTQSTPAMSVAMFCPEATPPLPLTTGRHSDLFGGRRPELARPSR